MSDTGDLALHEGDSGNGHAFLLFLFTHEVNGISIRRSLEMEGIITDTDTWLTPVANSMTEGPEPGNGHWILRTSGRNRQNGCTGEGDGLVYTATVDPV